MDKITIQKIDGHWELSFADDKACIRKDSLFEMFKFLVRYAKRKRI